MGGWCHAVSLVYSFSLRLERSHSFFFFLFFSPPPFERYFCVHAPPALAPLPSRALWLERFRKAVCGRTDFDWPVNGLESVCSDRAGCKATVCWVIVLKAARSFRRILSSFFFVSQIFK